MTAHIPKQRFLGAIPISSIKVGERLRQTNEGGVFAIQTSFGTLGQLAPIIVDTERNLLAGAHRMEAATRSGWSDIKATELDISHYSPEMAAIIIKLVEVDENLQRADLSEVERVKFIGERVDLTEKRIVRVKFETEEAAVKAAAAERAAALAAIKAAKDEDERATKQAAFNAAEKARNAAKNRKSRAEKSNGTVSSGAPEKSVPSKNTARGVSDVVAKELGLKKHRVSDLVSLRNVVGDAVLDVFAGTKLGTNNELRAYATLKREFPDAAERITRLNLKLKADGKLNNLYSPARELGMLIKQRNADQRAEKLKDVTGQREHALEKAQAVFNAATEWKAALGLLTREERQQYPEVDKVIELMTAATVRLRSAARPAKQKRTGTEHRYGQESEGKSRKETAEELKAHAAEVDAVIAAKAKAGKKSK